MQADPHWRRAKAAEAMENHSKEFMYARLFICLWHLSRCWLFRRVKLTRFYIKLRYHLRLKSLSSSVSPRFR
jgi:hypothetical protein